MNCKICNLSSDKYYSDALIMGKYSISYYRCENCGFIQAEQPFWIEEAYSVPINITDIGLASRNILQAEFTSALINIFFDSTDKFLDYGGGYGLFVRLMRDKGYDFYLYEPICQNIFAHSFEAQLSNDQKYLLITAFEVLEHLVDPLSVIDQILSGSDSLFFSTLLLPEKPPKPNEWWYYDLTNGQHISFYSRETLTHIAKKLGVEIYSNEINYHLLTRKKISRNLFNLSLKYRITKIINKIFQHKSLLTGDYEMLVNQQLLKQSN